MDGNRNEFRRIYPNKYGETGVIQPMRVVRSENAHLKRIRTCPKGAAHGFKGLEMAHLACAQQNNTRTAHRMTRVTGRSEQADDTGGR